MKKALFLALSLAFLLTACGETTLPDTSEQNPVDNTQETSLPESCLLYYDLGDASILAEDKSLPLAQNAGDGYQTSYSVWYDGEYQDLALQDGDSGISVADMPGGSAVFDYGAGLVVWNGERYHCAHLTAQDSYIPNISPNIPGGILLLEVSGDCWADGGTADVACFTGFGTVVICGSGTLRIDGAGIGQTYGKTMMESCEIGTRLAASVITTGKNVCPRYLPSEFGLDVSAPDDAQLALEL